MSSLGIGHLPNWSQWNSCSEKKIVYVILHMINLLNEIIFLLAIKHTPPLCRKVLYVLWRTLSWVAQIKFPLWQAVQSPASKSKVVIHILGNWLKFDLVKISTFFKDCVKLTAYFFWLQSFKNCLLTAAQHYSKKICWEIGTFYSSRDGR